MWIDNSEQQLIQGILNHGVSVLENAQTSSDLARYRQELARQLLDYPVPPREIDTTEWMIPQRYQQFDIEQWCRDQCTTDQQLERVETELELFRQHQMIPHLRAMKYVVDTLREHRIVWGVGRGSGVASYCLYLIGVHKIDSIKYQISLDEFFK